MENASLIRCICYQIPLVVSYFSLLNRRKQIVWSVSSNHYNEYGRLIMCIYRQSLWHIHFQAWAAPTNLINIEFIVNLWEMCGDGPRMTYAPPGCGLPASCPPPRPLPGHSWATPSCQLHQKKWDPQGRTIPLMAGRQRTGRGTSRAQATHGRVWAPPSRDVLMRGKLLGENMAGKLS